jgi:archaellum biogenesis protein FlaJ (TadC family)
VSRRGFLLLPFSAIPARAEDFDARVSQFHRHWEKFIRAFWGCRPESTERAQCTAALGAIDRREFGAARKAALSLFDLREG